ncbi:MAG: glutathione S-transferase family protein [Alphaproteobacteria bacterium]|nr:glutathione S-transferase family protein [Alphaproteobacteria bacterium]MCW5743085.1 glutathione S-transferase family protein [Alphaproteobacteria bacterium]
MLTIYGVYRSRASRNIWLLDELGVPFRHVPVIQHYRQASGPTLLHTRSPAFLKINPNGHVPTMDDDGLVLHESLAINLYLARKHGGSLAAANIAEDGQIGMWTLWAATEIEPRSIQVLYNRVGNPEGPKDEAVAQAAIAALRGPFAVLDRHLATHGGYAVGQRFSVADINLAECVRYASVATELFDGAPKVKAWLAACQARPAFRAMWARRDAEPA